MNTTPKDPSSARPPRRFPKAPLIIILVVLASMAGVAWLITQPPRPAPKLPPLRELPLQSTDPAPAAPVGDAAR